MEVYPYPASELSREESFMQGFRPVCAALGLCAVLVSVAVAAPAPTPGHVGGGHSLKVPAEPPFMTVANAPPGILDYDGIPTVEYATPANVAGLMYYCDHNRLVTDTTVRSLGRELARRDDIRRAADYAWGGQGMLRISPRRLFDMKTLNHDQRGAVCARTALMGPDLLRAERHKAAGRHD